MASFVRSWLIRGVILAILAGVGYGGWFAANWVSPENVRAALIAHLRTKVDDNVDVSVGDARLRLFGGIAVTDLRLTRRGETEPFYIVPSAVIHHDKERLHRGELTVRKIELDRPTFRVQRKADGTWNFTELAKSSSANEPMPMMLVRDGTIYLEDHRPDPMPPVVLCGLNLQLMNEPITHLKLEGAATLASASVVNAQGKPEPNAMTIPISFSVRLNRFNGHVAARVNLNDMEISPELAPLVSRWHPGLGSHLAKFSARANVTVEVTTPAEPEKPLQYSIRTELKDGKYEDVSLPWPVEQITGVVKLQDGRVIVEKLTAKFGKATTELTLRSRGDLFTQNRVVNAGPRVGPVLRTLAIAEMLHPAHMNPTAICEEDPITAAERLLERFDLSVAGLSLDDDLFVRLTERAGR